jgi:hypothetical protein
MVQGKDMQVIVIRLATIDEIRLEARQWQRSAI